MSSHNHQSTGRIQTESLPGGLKSDPNIAASVHDGDGGGGISVHPVSERARTAVLPPIMVICYPYPYRRRRGWDLHMTLELTGWCSQK